MVLLVEKVCRRVFIGSARSLDIFESTFERRRRKEGVLSKERELSATGSLSLRG